MKFEVGENIVEPIIRDQVAAAIAAQLGDPEEMIRKLVASALKTKTNANGVVSSSSFENKYDFLEALAAKTIREAATKALEVVVAEQAPIIQAAIEEALRKSPKKTASAIMSAFVDSDGKMSRYKTSVNFSFTHLD